MKNPMIENEREVQIYNQLAFLHDCQLATLYLDRVFDYIGMYSTLDLNDREVIDRLIDECKALVKNYESDTIELHSGDLRELWTERDALRKEIKALREVLLYSLDNQGRYRKRHQKIVDAAIDAAWGGKG